MISVGPSLWAICNVLSMDRAEGNCFTQELQLKTANSSSMEQFQVAELRILVENKQKGVNHRFLTVSACLKNFPTCASDRIIDTRSLNIRGEQLAIVPGTEHGVSLPANFAGTGILQTFPDFEAPRYCPTAHSTDPSQHYCMEKPDYWETNFGWGNFRQFQSLQSMPPDHLPAPHLTVSDMLPLQYRGDTDRLQYGLGFASLG